MVSMMGSVFGKIGEETPRFNSLGTFTTTNDQLTFEVRHYDAAVAIQTAMTAKDSGAFMRLAGYIGVRGQAQNTRQEGISMTSPVVSSMNMEDGGDSVMTDMQFVLPQSRFGGDAQSAPAPSSDQVKVLERPAKVMAVHTFSGSWSDEQFAEKVKLLTAAVESMTDFKWQLKSPLVSETYRYNPPWTLANMRTNEVAVELVEKKLVAQ